MPKLHTIFFKTPDPGKNRESFIGSCEISRSKSDKKRLIILPPGRQSDSSSGGSWQKRKPEMIPKLSSSMPGTH